MLKRRRRAGTYAEERYRRGLRSWRAKNRRLFLALCAPFIVVGIVVGILAGNFIAWFAGMVAGAFAAMWIVLRETPPRYVEKWHDGTEGERKTEKALRPLERAGWHVVHDIQNGYGNYDHIAVGSTGVYLLESKNLQGIVEVKGGVPHLARRHDPEENMAFDRIRPRALTDAVRVKEDIERRTGHRVWVQAVVVFWSEFPEGSVEDDNCFFVDGSRLRDWLQNRPRRLDQAAVEEIAAGIEGIAEDAAADRVRPELSPA
ncbi:MAG: NERD domain-containing protein [Solirubrobacterales bacterium]